MCGHYLETFLSVEKYSVGLASNVLSLCTPRVFFLYLSFLLLRLKSIDFDICSFNERDL
jgi:hypothetical protein